VVVRWKLTIQGKASSPTILIFATILVNGTYSMSQNALFVGKKDLSGRLLEGLGFDWSDALSFFSSLNQTALSLGLAKISFNISGSFTIDPSVVSTSTTDLATSYPFQRKAFFANGRFWAFYSDGTSMLFKTSVDGLTWSAATAVRGAAVGYYFSAATNGTHIAYAHAAGGALSYRLGVLNADGTISWSAPEQTVPTTVSPSAAYEPSIAFDSNGFVWIGFTEASGTLWNYVVTRSSLRDGTWSTAAGFPFQLLQSGVFWPVSIVPLSAGKMLASYVSASNIAVRSWSGSSWNPAVSTANAVGLRWSASSAGDTGHIAYLKYSTNDIIYARYDYATNSLTETILVSSATSTSAPVISSDPSTGDLYVFAATKTTGSPAGWTADHIYYTKFTASSGTWGSWVDWINESTELLKGADRLSSFYQAYGGNAFIGLMYMTKTASPFNVKFAFLQLNNPPNAPTLSAPAANSRFNPRTSVTFRWAFSDPNAGNTQSAYQLQIGDSAFSTIYVDTGQVNSATGSVTVTLPSTIGLYYWRVRTWDNYGVVGPYSSGQAIIVDGIKLVQQAIDLKGQKVYVKAQYAYDGNPIPNANISYAGLYALTNSTGWAVFDLSSLNTVPWNATSYPISEPAFGLRARLQNQSIGFNKVPVSPFSIRATGQIVSPVWNDIARKLSFNATGDVIVKVGDFGVPYTVEVNGAIYTNWVYDIVLQEILIRNLGSKVVLTWQASPPVGAGGGGGGAGVSPPSSQPMEQPPLPPVITPPTNLITAGLFGIIFIIGGALTYRALQRRQSVSAVWRKRDKVRKIKWKRRSAF
jgi:hypothetical protein